MTTFLLPMLVGTMLLVVFTYLYEQSRAAYFLAWQLAWGCYTATYVIFTIGYLGHQTPLTVWCAKVLFAMVPLFIFASTRLISTSEFPLHWRDVALLIGFMSWAAIDTHFQLQSNSEAVFGAFFSIGGLNVPIGIYLGIAVLLGVCSVRFWLYGQRLHSIPYRVLSACLGIWSALLLMRQYHSLLSQRFGEIGHFLGPVPQMLIGISMVMVLYENERRMVQESLLAFSSLEVDSARIMEAEQLAPTLLKMLDRMLRPLQAERGAIWISDSWRRVLPGVQTGFSPELLSALSSSQGGDYLADLLTGKDRLSFRGAEDLHSDDSGNFRAARLKEIFGSERLRGFSLAALRTHDHLFGVVLIAHRSRRGYGSSQLRLLSAMARQLGMALENHVLMQDAARRSEEFELLAQIGQVVSSRLDPEEVLRTVHRELSRLFDARTFYIAFIEGDEVRFEFEFDDGELVPKRTRKATAGLTEHIIRTGEPMLIRSDLEKVRERLGLVKTGRRPARCFCGVPVFMYSRAVGVMAALNYEREFVYEQRDLDVMKTAAGQVAVAMENARLFAEEQRRSKYLEFINNVSKTAISSQEPEAMMADIVSDIQNTFRYDHIGIGILDYANKDIEIKAEAGTTERALGRRIPLGVGILGRVARTGEMQLAQSTAGSRLLGILPEAKSVVSIPISYGDTLLGVLNVESRRENAFPAQEVLILRTLADLLATALHNAFVFQKMQQQSITDGLTGIKTRRFFNEALQSEWKRASRSGRPFSVVLIDLDKFKNVNDTMGHLEGDLVLARIGRILEQKSRQSNVVARYGGDEFVILMPETGVEQAQILSERLRLWIATDTVLNERQITGSFGVATFPVHGASAEDILRIADMGMYAAKRAGGNHVSTPEEFGHGEGLLAHRQLVTTFLENFLQRAHIGPDSIQDLIAMLDRIATFGHEPSGTDALMDAVRILNQSAEARETGAAGHGDAVAEFAEAIGRELRMQPDELVDLIQAARLHDVGKILIPAQILNKEDKLTEEEYRVVQHHAALGARILGAIPGCVQMANYVRHHHERFDGGGYPDKLSGDAIPLASRVIAVAETYVHMTLDRPYAPRRTPQQACIELESLSGTQFDGMVVRTLIGQIKRAKAVRSEA